MQTLKEIQSINRCLTRKSLKAIEKMLHGTELRINGNKIEHSHNRWWVIFSCPDVNKQVTYISISYPRSIILHLAINNPGGFYTNYKTELSFLTK